MKKSWFLKIETSKEIWFSLNKPEDLQVIVMFL